MDRRNFLKSAVVTGAGLIILPSGTISGANAASNKLNIALIGTWGRSHSYFKTLKNENVVALCDVNQEHLDSAAVQFPGVKKYTDWRKCLEQKDIDAVMCATPDHTHAFIATWAMNRGLHCYCEKPLANSVEEARLVRSKYLEKKNKLATQCGTQRHARPNFDRVRELIKGGAIGELKSVRTWGDRQLRRPGYLPAAGRAPKHINWDLWIGPSPKHPYNPGYFSGGSGMNCLQWNMYWDFGNGQVGDMGSHTMDLAWNAIDAKLPLTASGKGEAYNPEVSPVELELKFEHPANDWRPAIDVYWHQGGSMPRSPSKYVDLNKIGHGAMFKGSEGYVITDYDSRIILPYGKTADMTYYDAPTKKEVAPPIGHFIEEWTNACKGDLKTSCDFDYSGNMIEQMLLGLVSYRVGEKLQYDGKAGRVTNNSKANDLLKKKYRWGWKLDG